MARWNDVRASCTIQIDGEDVDLVLEAKYMPGREATRLDPPEPDEVIIKKATIDKNHPRAGEEVILTDEQYEVACQAIADEFAKG